MFKIFGSKNILPGRPGNPDSPLNPCAPPGQIPQSSPLPPVNHNQY